MIVVAGFSRTGTSVIFECLKRSGFYPGEEKDLFGHKYLSQYLPFQELNRALINIIVTNRRYLSHADILNAVVAHKKEKIEKTLEQAVKNVLNKIVDEKIEIIKDPYLGLIVNVWYTCSPLFREAKYIWLKRDAMEIAKSLVRMQKFHGMPIILKAFKFTVSEAYKLCQLHTNGWEMMMPYLNHIEVQFEDLFKDVEKVKDRISEFIGRPFNTDLISLEETWKIKRKPQ